MGNRLYHFAFLIILICIMLFFVLIFGYSSTHKQLVVDALEPTKHTLFGLSRQHFDFLIFQIGFNKCGTTSLYHFMSANNIPSLHNAPCKLGTGTYYLSTYMKANNEQHKPVLPEDECTDYYQFYSDFGVQISGEYWNMKRAVLGHFDVLNYAVYNRSIRTWHQILAQQHPDAKFILNYRNLNAWLKSKYLHRPAYFRQHRWNEHKEKINEFIKEYNQSKRLNRGYLTDYDMLRMYERNWYLYHCNVIKYFSDALLVHNLLLFDVERDGIEKLIDFFNAFGMKLDAKYWYQKNKSSKNKWISEAKIDQIQKEKWSKIEKMYPQYSTNYSVDNRTEYERIQQQCKLLGVLPKPKS